MTELTQLKRRVKQLERCLNDVSNMLADAHYELAHMGMEESGEYKLIEQAFRRINRTIKPNKNNEQKE